MASIVLVHGAFHGGWCWERVVPLLEAAGHRPTVSELPRETLSGDTATVQADVDSLDGDVVVCGHSYGGAVITGLRPDGLRHLVYLAALMPDAGESMGEQMMAGPQTPLTENLVYSGDGAILSVNPDAAAEAFYADCDPVDQQAAVARLKPQATATFAEKIPTPVWRSVPSTYVRCTLDQTLHPDIQARLAERAGERVDWATSHSPFYSQPQLVADLLVKLAG